MRIKFYKKLSLVLCIILSVSTMHLQPVAAKQQFDVDECFDIAIGALRGYYENIDLGTTLPLSGDIFADASVYDYLINKINAKVYIAEEAGLFKENYQLTFNLMSVEQTEEYCKLRIQAEAVYNYIDLDVQSGFGKVSDITFVSMDNKYCISDWYDPYDDYDMEVRNNGTVAIADVVISENQSEYLESVEEYFENEYNIPDSSVQISPPVKASRAATLYSLDKSKIVSWARSNLVLSPSSGGSNVPYYDFYQITGAWDCTNFVSHALLAGGAVPYDTNQGQAGGSTGWYYKSLNNRSASWSGVINLHTFLTTNNVKGPVGTSITYSTFTGNNPSTSAPYAVGDILQFYDGGINAWRHSTIITAYYNISGSVWGAIVTGRSGPRQYNDNVKAEDINPGQSKRIIKLSGYYK